jgi:hypothetical protein
MNGEQLELHPGYVGAEQALDAAPELWRMVALAEVHRLAARGIPFTTDDVLPSLDAFEGVETRALGAVMRRAQKAGWVRPGGYVTSERRESHMRPKRLWIPTLLDDPA